MMYFLYILYVLVLISMGMLVFNPLVAGYMLLAVSVGLVIAVVRLWNKE